MCVFLSLSVVFTHSIPFCVRVRSFRLFADGKVRIGSKFRGTSVKVESGNVVSGSGAVVANVPLHQDRAYWEVTIVDLPEGSNFALGVAKQCVGTACCLTR